MGCAVTAEAAGIALKMAVLLEFQRARRPGLSLRWIVVPGGARRNDAHGSLPGRRRLPTPGVAAQRVVRELEVVALADEDAERAVALARRGRRLGHAPAQQRERRLELVLVRPARASAAAMCSGATPSARSLRSMRSEPQASSRRRSSAKRTREARVVDEAALERARRRTTCGLLGRDALPGEDAAQLELRPLAPVERAPGEGPRALEPLLGVRQALACRDGVHGAYQRRPDATGDAAHAATVAAASRRRLDGARPRGRSGSRGPGRCPAPRRPWPRSPWPPRRARRGTPWRCCGPGRAARRRRRRTSPTW